MPDVFVNIGVATICFLRSCYPALVGDQTYPGIYHLELYSTEAPGYGGLILVYDEKGDEVWAIHRVLNIPGEHRLERLQSGNASKRRHITLGCVNVDPEVFQKLVDCCSTSKLYIIP